MVLDDSVYYKKTPLDIVNGRMGAFRNTKSRYNPKKLTTIKENQIFELGESKFIVGSETNSDVFYQVDMVSGFCECKAGKKCDPCKHKDAISKFFKVAEFSVLPDADTNIRGLYHYIAEGIVCNNAWYRDLDKPDQVTDVNTFVKNRQSNVLIEGMSCDTCEVSNDLELPVPVGGEKSDEKDSGEESDKEDDEILNNFITVLDAGCFLR